PLENEGGELGGGDGVVSAEDIAVAEEISSEMKGTPAQELPSSPEGTEEQTVNWGMWRDLKTTTMNGRQYAVINGRYYTREAVDRMTPTGYGKAVGGYEARGIPPSVVQDVIENGESYEVTVKGEVRTVYNLNGIRVVTAQRGKIVITVYPNGGK
ncbi:MAG: hypothetical protein OWT28_10395, partial [Firmicutes bacterium]|nr:hypothetical protein [Bacillota bacterium]